MKKFVFTLLLVFVCHLGYAQSINGLFNEFGSEKNADCVKVSSFMMSLGKMFAGHDEDAEIIIRSAKILDLDECSPDVKQRFSRQFEALSNNGYETLMQMNEDGERIHIQMRMKKEVIRELLIAIIEDDECSLIQVNGKIRKQDIAQLINDQTTNKKKHGRR